MRRILPSLDRLLRRISLRVQIAILLALAMLPVGIFAAAQAFGNYAEVKRLRLEAYTQEAVQAGREEQAAVQEAFGALGALNTLLDADSSSCIGVVKAFVLHDPTVPSAGFVDLEGKPRCAYPASSVLDLKERMDFGKLREAPRRVVDAIAPNETPVQAVLILAQPVYREGALKGTLFMTISSRYLQWVARSTAHEPEARFGIVNASGLGILPAHRNDMFDWLPPPGTLKTYLSKDDRLHELPARNGEARVYAIAPIFGNDIFEVASWPRDTIPTGVTFSDFLTIALPLLMWALAVLVAYFAVDQLALRHIVYLDRLVGAYGRSGRSLRAQRIRDAPAEIAKLGASFDEMAEEIEMREQTLIETVEEKDTLLREVYHRVKNNLQLIISLMRLQIRDADSTREQLGLERLQERIQGLALVHQMIYESENMNAVRLDRLIAEIAANLRSGSASVPTAIDLKLDLDRVEAPPDKAVPIILFATEAIVNTFKHVLSHVESGKLAIWLKQEPDTLRIGVVNSTLGQRPVPDAEGGRKGIGAQLIDGFARQLRARVVRTRADDTFGIELVVPRWDLDGEA